MFLCPVQVFGLQGFGVQALIHVAIESQHRLLGVFSRELRAPRLIARHIQAGKRIAQMHQAGDVVRRFLLQDVNQLG